MHHTSLFSRIWFHSVNILIKLYLALIIQFTLAFVSRANIFLLIIIFSSFHLGSYSHELRPLPEESSLTLIFFCCHVHIWTSCPHVFWQRTELLKVTEKYCWGWKQNLRHLKVLSPPEFKASQSPPLHRAYSILNTHMHTRTIQD